MQWARSLIVGPMEPYSLHLDTFQGPLELLCHLIQKSEIDVLDIPLHTITSQFYELLEQETSLEQGGDFLTHASSLLLLKSRSLLPGAQGEEGGLDPRLDILEKIREYCTFKRAATTFGKEGALEQEQLARGFKEEPVEVETPSGTGHLSGTDLASLLEKVLRQASYKPQAIQEEEWPFPEVLTYMRDRIERDKAVAFDHLFSPSRPKGHLITLFLALLEMMKLQEVAVVDRGEQNIWIEGQHG